MSDAWISDAWISDTWMSDTWMIDTLLSYRSFLFSVSAIMISSWQFNSLPIIYSDLLTFLLFLLIQCDLVNSKLKAGLTLIQVVDEVSEIENNDGNKRKWYEMIRNSMKWRKEKDMTWGTVRRDELKEFKFLKRDIKIQETLDNRGAHKRGEERKEGERRGEKVAGVQNWLDKYRTADNIVAKMKERGSAKMRRVERRWRRKELKSYF